MRSRGAKRETACTHHTLTHVDQKHEKSVWTMEMGHGSALCTIACFYNLYNCMQRPHLPILARCARPASCWPYPRAALASAPSWRPGEGEMQRKKSHPHRCPEGQYVFIEKQENTPTAATHSSLCLPVQRAGHLVCVYSILYSTHG